MRIPENVTAQANPLARATMQQMVERHGAKATASMQKPPSRVDIVDNVKQRQAEASERAKASMLKICGTGQPAKATPNLQVDIVANMRARHDKPAATAVDAMRRQLRAQGITTADEA